MRQLKLGTLRATLCGGTDREGGGSGPVVVLMHGYGAPGTDLVQLWRELAVPAEVRFVFPEAPLDLGAGARAWWPLDMAKLQDRFAPGLVEHLTLEVPDGLAEARGALLEAFDTLQRDFGATPETTLIGGFSQGAMLATDLVLRSERKFAGLVVLSGTLIARAEWLALMPARAGLPVLQSHGRADPLLPFALAEQLRDELSAAGLLVEFIPFNGGHSISASALDGLAKLIRNVGTAKQP